MVDGLLGVVDFGLFVVVGGAGSGGAGVDEGAGGAGDAAEGMVEVVEGLDGAAGCAEGASVVVDGEGAIAAGDTGARTRHVRLFYAETTGRKLW